MKSRKNSILVRKDWLSMQDGKIKKIPWRESIRAFTCLWLYGSKQDVVFTPVQIRRWVRIGAAIIVIIIVAIGMIIYQFMALQQAQDEVDLLQRQRELVTQKIEILQQKVNIMGKIAQELQMDRQGKDSFPKNNGSHTEEVNIGHSSYDDLALAAGKLDMYVNAQIIKFILIKEGINQNQGAGSANNVVDAKVKIPSIWPVRGRITSFFGPRIRPMAGASSFHEGVDIGVPIGTPVHATATGIVALATWVGGYGNLVEITHSEGYTTRYAHNSLLLVVAGQHVSTGDIIALSGSTGKSTGPHVHYEVRLQGKALNPILFLP